MAVLSDPEAILPYGRLIRPPAAEAGDDRELIWWPALATFAMREDDTAELGLARVMGRASSIGRLERHHRSSEFLIPVDGDILVPVSLAASSSTPVPDAVDSSSVHMILLPLGSALMLHPGTWHAPGVPVGSSTYYWCLLRRGTGTSDTEYRSVANP
jgi:ureidoglycolate hydrolase